MGGWLERFAGNSAAAPVLFLVLFLVIGGAALYLTPRIARWLDKKSTQHRSFYDGMLTEDPRKKPAEPAEAEKPAEPDRTEESDV